MQEQPLATTFLTRAVLANKLAHAYLFTGRARQDSLELGKGLAAFLNCTQRQAISAEAASLSLDQLSCSVRFSSKDGQLVSDSSCQSCRWISADKHPQALIRLDGEGSKSGRVSVERARQITEELSKESQYTRVILIEDADAELFHRPAANAILKTIESPRSSVVFMLFAVRAEDVLPTVVSRCQVIPLKSKHKHLLTTAHAQAVPGAEPAVSMKVIVNKLQSLSKRSASIEFLDIAHELLDLANDGQNINSLIDFLVEAEVVKLGKQVTNDSRMCLYAKAQFGWLRMQSCRLSNMLGTNPRLNRFVCLG